MSALLPRQAALDERAGAALYRLLDAALAADQADARSFASYEGIPATDPDFPQRKQVWLAASNAMLIAWHDLGQALASAGDPVLERGGMRFWRRNGTYHVSKGRA